MADPTGFVHFQRADVAHRPVVERIADYRELDVPHTEKILRQQAARCMDCGVPFCHGAGCPLHNRMPEFNDLVYRGRWQEAARMDDRRAFIIWVLCFGQNDRRRGGAGSSIKSARN